MDATSRLAVVNIVQKVVVAAMVALWLYAIYSFATSGLPIMRQMLGCMFSTMLVFGLLSLGSKALARYRARLEEQQAG